MHADFSSNWSRLVLIWALSISLASCSGGGSNPTVPPPDHPTVQGELKSSTLLNTISKTDIAQALNALNAGIQGLDPVYDVTSYRLEYLTSDVHGQIVRASGLVSIPIKPAGAASPVLSYQHGTIFLDSQAPSNHAVASELVVAVASLGYIVVAPDYVGYGSSKGTPHPYLLAAPSAAAVIDFLTAAKTWRRDNNVYDNGQLFLVGYSEGGYVSMAAHRAMQANNSDYLQQLRMEVAGAGPYDVRTSLDELLRLVGKEQPLLAALLKPGLLRYLDPNLRPIVSRELLKHMLPGDTDVVFDTQVIDDYLADDIETIARISSVHDWKPNLPVRLYHGQDDQTVPYASALSTLQTMQARGVSDLVSLTDCPAVPSSHIGCVPSFLTFMLGQLGTYAQGL